MFGVGIAAAMTVTSKHAQRAVNKPAAARSIRSLSRDSVTCGTRNMRGSCSPSIAVETIAVSLHAVSLTADHCLVAA